MGLDTDDIVALPMDISLVLIAIGLFVLMFFMKSMDVFKELKRILVKAQTSAEERHKPILQLIIGDKEYAAYMSELEQYCIERYRSIGHRDPNDYINEYFLDENWFNSLENKPLNPHTGKEFEWEKWRDLNYRRFIYDYNDKLFFRPSVLWHRINDRIDSKEL